MLRGVDGIVFVGDCQWDKMTENVESFENLVENLKLQGDNIDNIPYLLQYNKRDLPNVAPVNYLDFLLNNRGTRRPTVNAVASKGVGVFETLNMIAQIVLNNFIRKHSGAAREEEKRKELVLM